MVKCKINGDKYHGECNKELTEGYFNVAYEVDLTNGKKTLLKIAPSKGFPLLFYIYNYLSENPSDNFSPVTSLSKSSSSFK